MNNKRLALGIVAIAIVMGALGDLLLRAIPWGLNVLIWVVALAAAMAWLVRWQSVALKANARWMIVAALVFAAGFVWRDSPTLKALDLLALLVSFCLMSLRTEAGAVYAASLIEYALGAFNAGVSTLFGSISLASHDVEWRSARPEGATRQWAGIGRGILFTIPLVLVFGGLLASADAVFQNIVTRFIDISFTDAAVHLLVGGIFAWIVGGFLRGIFLGRQIDVKNYPRPAFLSIGLADVAIPLAALDLLFLIFVIVQFKYFFGGAFHVESSIGLTYSEYARRGFFELVAVVALVLPLLLLAHWLLDKEQGTAAKTFRVLAGILIILVLVIAASAVQRMQLYQREYGMTELRFYTMAFMGWLGLVLLWFAGTVLRGRRPRFAFGALIAGFVMIAVLHWMNPDASIVRSNAARAAVGRSFDYSYATSLSLSADAVPALIDSLLLLSRQDQRWVAQGVLNNWPPERPLGWRSWSWARWQAAHSVQRNQDVLRRALSPQL
jgi:hypothetical protein